MALNHQMGHAIRGEMGEPAKQNLMERLLADPNRGVAENPVDDKIVWNVIRGRDMDPVGGADSRCVPLGQRACSLVDVDGPNLGVRCSGGSDTGDRSPAAADVEDHVIGGCERWRLEEQEFGADIEFVS